MWERFFKAMVALLSVAIFVLWLWMVGGTVLWPQTWPWHDFVATNFLFLGGVPGAGAIAFVVVYVFKATDGEIEFEAGPVKFRGASGPVALWVLSFLAVVGGINWLAN